MLCLDLDRFKEVNDLFGHAAGDDLLRVSCQSLTKAVEGIGIAARLGGDEFAVLLPDAQSPDRAGRVADSIFEAFRTANEAMRLGRR